MSDSVEKNLLVWSEKNEREKDSLVYPVVCVLSVVCTANII